MGATPRAKNPGRFLCVCWHAGCLVLAKIGWLAVRYERFRAYRAPDNSSLDGSHKGIKVRQFVLTRRASMKTIGL